MKVNYIKYKYIIVLEIISETGNKLKLYHYMKNDVNIVQSEDVMEHIEYDLLKNTINDIYRILKPGGLFRLSMPDYSCNVLYNQSEKDEQRKNF